MEAVPKASASFTWRSILGALPLVNQGIRWRVGTGENIRIWVDNWIPRDYGLRPYTPDLYDLGEVTVANLIDHETGGWNSELVETLFWEEDSKALMSIPIAVSNVQDIKIWHYSKHGRYSVKHHILWPDTFVMWN